jgi:hypothetical protein
MKREPSSFSIDEWIQLALCEYEQIASLSNVQSLIRNAAASTHASSRTKINNGDGNCHNIYDPKVLSTQMQRRNIHNLISSYSERIDDVRTTHASLKSKVSRVLLSKNEEVLDTQMRPRPSSMEIALTNHIELSERVIRTIMKSPPTGGSGPCGLFYENGLIRTATAKDHENNIVALAALRASVSRLKKDYGV